MQIRSGAIVSQTNASSSSSSSRHISMSQLGYIGTYLPIYIMLVVHNNTPSHRKTNHPVCAPDRTKFRVSLMQSHVWRAGAAGPR